MRPPHINGGTTIATEINYLIPHTEVSFWLAAVTPVDLYINNIYFKTYDTAAVGYGWLQTTEIVPAGSKTYRWEVTPTQTGRPSVYLDDISVN